MKDKVLASLAFIGLLLIIVVVAIHHYRTTGVDETKQFGANNYYVPKDYTSNPDDAAQLYAELSGKRDQTCPNSEMDQLSGTSGQVIEPSSGMTIFVNGDLVNGLTYDMLGQKSDANTAGVRLGDILPGQWSSNYAELVAPFNFTFACTNSNSPTKIVLKSNDGTKMIVFDNISNWLCAGQPGTSWVLNDGSEISWENHLNNRVNADGNEIAHKTLIGNSKNSDIQGGSSGSIVGYGNRDTRVIFYDVSTGTDRVISMQEFYTDKSATSTDSQD